MTTDTAGSTARELPWTVVHYMRKHIAYNTTGIATAATVKVGTLPIGAIVEKVQVLVTTVFNAGTTNPLDVGTSSNNDAFVDSTVADVDLTALGSTFVWRGADDVEAISAATDVYVTYVETGTAATTGAAEIVVFYTVDNDL
jgi:phage tail tape-measure protein